MKTSLFSTALVAVALFVSSASYANSGKTETNEVKITAIENSGSGKEDLKAWVLNFADGTKPVTVTLRKDGDERNFLVKADFFEICYVAGKKGFGAKRVPHALSEVPYEINSVVLNEEAVRKQKVLAPGTISDEDALKLIVGFLPDLMNKNYEHLLN